MKKINSTLGVISVIILITGMIFKQNHLAGANIIQCVGSLGLVVFFIVYMVIGLKPLTKGLEKSVGVAGALSMCLVVFGVAFKTMHWPGANVFVWLSQIGLIATSVLLIIDSIIESDKTKQSIKTLFTLVTLTAILTYVTQIIAHKG
jgi:uncharacterized membrane protein